MIQRFYGLGFGTIGECTSRMNAFNTEKLTGKSEVDFLIYCRQLTQVIPEEEFAEKVDAKAKEEVKQ